MRERRFVAIDGESFTTEGDHKYVLLACSLGEYIFKEEGLSTEDCFQYLFKIRARAKRYIFVAFGLNYDANMMLVDLPQANLEALWKKKQTTWHDYRIEWIPGKWFSISRFGSSIRIYDVFGFFQASFVTALRKWGIEPQSEIESMKQARSSFDNDMKEQV